VKHFYRFNETTGELTSWGSTEEAAVPQDSIECEVEATAHTHYVSSGTLTAYTSGQAAAKRVRAPLSNWDNNSMTWVDIRSQHQINQDNVSARIAARDDSRQSITFFQAHALRRVVLALVNQTTPAQSDINVLNSAEQQNPGDIFITPPAGLLSASGVAPS
jgi:hypothetical protein